MKKILLFCLLLVCCVPVCAGTYYIDYAGGSNSNNGTAKATAWKSHPYMPNAVGCAGTPPSYSHTAGDHFIFKGGVTWPNACFTMSPSAGGASGNPDYYGVDTTWGTGTASGTVNTSSTQVTLQTGTPFDPAPGDWAGGTITINGVNYTIASVHDAAMLYLTTSAGTQTGVTYSASLFVLPTFDAQGQCAGTSGANCGTKFILANVSYITIDRIRFTNARWQGVPTYGTATMIDGGNNTDQIVENSIFDNWTHDVCGSPGNCDLGAAMSFGTSTPTNTTISRNTFAQCYNSTTCGDSMAKLGAIHGATTGTIDGNTCFNLMGCMIPSPNGGRLTVSNNLVYNAVNTTQYDSAQHPDLIFLFGANSVGVTVANNVIHDVNLSAANNAFVIDFEACAGSANYIYNNIIWNDQTQAPIDIDDGDCAANPNGSGASYLWNNTIATPTAASGAALDCMHVVSRFGNADVYGIVDLRNNHCISADSTPTLYSTDLGITFSSILTSNSVVQSVSTAVSQGYADSGGNCINGPISPCKPTSGGNSTVGAGVNFTSASPGCGTSGLSSLCNDTTVANLRTTLGRSSSGTWDAGAYQYNGSPPATIPAPAQGMLLGMLVTLTRNAQP